MILGVVIGLAVCFLCWLSYCLGRIDERSAEDVRAIDASLTRMERQARAEGRQAIREWGEQ